MLVSSQIFIDTCNISYIILLYCKRFNNTNHINHHGYLWWRMCNVGQFVFSNICIDILRSSYTQTSLIDPVYSLNFTQCKVIPKQKNKNIKANKYQDSYISLMVIISCTSLLSQEVPENKVSISCFIRKALIKLSLVRNEINWTGEISLFTAEEGGNLGMDYNKSLRLLKECTKIHLLMEGVINRIWEPKETPYLTKYWHIYLKHIAFFPASTK